ncbi:MULTISPECIES: hypothetical protein [unclassified Sinorhizobium]|uniref:hypothetical protein n=1 Tax=unclassified Sinorhizobium TaxID=2613772 RepID=UPI003525DB95
MTEEPATIVPADYPELKSLIGNHDLSHSIAAKEAFAIYERNWRFVDVEKLTEREAQLIRELAHTYGNGVLLLS